MSRRERDKGARGQLAVRRLLESHGWDVSPMAGGEGARGKCDLIAIRGSVTLAVECKNQSVLRLPLWRRQTLASAPEGTVPVLVYRAGREWLANYHDDGVWFVAGTLAEALRRV